jgi:hypothetical protein
LSLLSEVSKQILQLKASGAVITLTTLRSLRIQKREREKKIVFKIDYSKQLKVEIAALQESKKKILN